MKKSSAKNFAAFSLVEMSVVIFIVGLLIAGVAQTSKVINKGKISSAQSQTKQSIVKNTPNLVVWYEATLDESFNSTERVDGAEVSTWNDINPQALISNPANQGTSLNRPIYTENVINGLPALKFGGTKVLSMNKNFCTDNFTVFVVIKIGVTTTNGPFDGWQVLFADSTNLADDSVPVVVAGSTVLTSNGGLADTTLYAANGKVVVDNFPHIVTVSRNMDTGRRDIWVDGANNGNDLNGASGRNLTANMNMLIGRSANNANYPGYIGEIVIFNRALLSSERAEIEKYLSKKWGTNI